MLVPTGITFMSDMNLTGRAYEYFPDVSIAPSSQGVTGEPELFVKNLFSDRILSLKSESDGSISFHDDQGELVAVIDKDGNVFARIDGEIYVYEAELSEASDPKAPVNEESAAVSLAQVKAQVCQSKEYVFDPDEFDKQCVMPRAGTRAASCQNVARNLFGCVENFRADDRQVCKEDIFDPYCICEDPAYLAENDKVRGGLSSSTISAAGTTEEVLGENAKNSGEAPIVASSEMSDSEIPEAGDFVITIEMATGGNESPVEDPAAVSTISGDKMNGGEGIYPPTDERYEAGPVNIGNSFDVATGDHIAFAGDTNDVMARMMRSDIIYAAGNESRETRSPIPTSSEVDFIIRGALCACARRREEGEEDAETLPSSGRVAHLEQRVAGASTGASTDGAHRRRFMPADIASGKKGWASLSTGRAPASGATHFSSPRNSRQGLALFAGDVAFLEGGEGIENIIAGFGGLPPSHLGLVMSFGLAMATDHQDQKIPAPFYAGGQGHGHDEGHDGNKDGEGGHGDDEDEPGEGVFEINRMVVSYA